MLLLLEQREMRFFFQDFFLLSYTSFFIAADEANCRRFLLPEDEGKESLRSLRN